MKIAVDFDSVLADTMKLWVFEYNKQYPSKKITIKNINIWNFFDNPEINLTKEEAFVIFDFCWRHWEFLKTMERNLGTKLERLSTLGHVDIVTAVSKNKDSVRKWLIKKNIPNEAVFSDEKWNLKYDYYIDDSPTVAEKVSKMGKICLLMDQPWNREVKTNGKVKRIYSLSHAYDFINGHS